MSITFEDYVEVKSWDGKKTYVGKVTAIWWPTATQDFMYSVKSLDGRAGFSKLPPDRIKVMTEEEVILHTLGTIGTK